MNILRKESTGDKSPLRINLKTKAKLISLCYQMKDNVPLLKFNDMTFVEEHNEKFNNNKLADTKPMSVKEKYKHYQAMGLIEPGDDENEDEEEPNQQKFKLKESPYNERIRYFQKYGKFPSKAA